MTLTSRVSYALSAPERAHIYATIAVACRPLTFSMFLKIGDRALPKSTLAQHFRILREARLVRSRRASVEVHNTARDEELEQRFPDLLRSITRA
jgi:DNA-binding transcriptional ArsR family regulator